MRILFLLFISAFAGCGDMKDSRQQATVSCSIDSIYHLQNRFALLRQHAGKKEGLTQQQLDSIQNITSLRKKF